MYSRVDVNFSNEIQRYQERSASRREQGQQREANDDNRSMHALIKFVLFGHGAEKKAGADSLGNNQQVVADNAPQPEIENTQQQDEENDSASQDQRPPSQMDQLDGSPDQPAPHVQQHQSNIQIDQRVQEQQQLRLTRFESLYTAQISPQRQADQAQPNQNSNYENGLSIFENQAIQNVSNTRRNDPASISPRTPLVPTFQQYSQNQHSQTQNNNNLQNLPPSSFESPFIPPNRQRHMMSTLALQHIDNISNYDPLPQNLNKITDIFVIKSEFIVARTVRGICFVYNRVSKETLIINKSPKENIKSTFYNQVNNSIFMVSAKTRGFISIMKCRSISFQQLQQGQVRGTKLFTNFTLQYPDFVEVDDLNQKVVTKHSFEKCFRIWDLGSYKMLYVLRDENLLDFKICNGVMLLQYEQINNDNTMPMSILDVETGKQLMSLNYQKEKNELEFLESYNEKILIKYKDQPLKIVDMLTEKIDIVKNFETPEAFIFIYEREIFLSLKDGKISMHSIYGDLITTFNKKHVYSMEPLSQNQNSLNLEEYSNSEQKIYQLCLSDSRCKLLTVVKEKWLPESNKIKQNSGSQQEDQKSSKEASTLNKRNAKSKLKMEDPEREADERSELCWSDLEEDQNDELDSVDLYSQGQKRQKLSKQQESSIISSKKLKRKSNMDNNKNCIDVNQKENVYINVIDMQKGDIIAKIEPYKLSSYSSKMPIRSRINDQIQITQDNYQDKRKRLLQELQTPTAQNHLSKSRLPMFEQKSISSDRNAEGFEWVFNRNNENQNEVEDRVAALSLLYSQPKVHMTPKRYIKLMEEVSVVYYDEQRNEILTGHRNGAICIWN